MAVSDALVREFRTRVDWPVWILRDALNGARGDVDKALLGLVDRGLDPTRLNARVVPEELFVRAKKAMLKNHLNNARPFLAHFVGKPEEAEWRRTVASLERQLNDPQNFAGLREQIAKTQKKKFSEEAIAADVAPPPTKGKKSPRATTLKMPPLPPLKHEIDEWVGKDVLKSWQGFRAGGGGGGRGSSGKVAVSVAREEDDDGVAPPPAAEQVAAYRHLKKNEKAVRDAVLKAVFAEFAKLKRRGFFEDLEDDEQAALAKVKSAADLKRHTEPQSVRVFDHAKGGLAYVGLDFGCTWDEEHGLGVLLHKSRVVKVGDAEVSFNEHGAKRDGAKRIRA